VLEGTDGALVITSETSLEGRPELDAGGVSGGVSRANIWESPPRD
jgi:hypothetical protein